MDNSTDDMKFNKGWNKEIEKFFDGWDGYSIICLDNENANITLSGTESTMNS